MSLTAEQDRFIRKYITGDFTEPAPMPGQVCKTISKALEELDKRVRSLPAAGADQSADRRRTLEVLAYETNRILLPDTLTSLLAQPNISKHDLNGALDRLKSMVESSEFISIVETNPLKIKIPIRATVSKLVQLARSA